MAINYGAPGLQAANFLTLFGALDRLGGFFVLASIREIGPDHGDRDGWGGGHRDHRGPGRAQGPRGARRLQVLGVDPVKNLVVPRFLALMVATGLFDIYAVLFGIFGGLLAELYSGGTPGPFWNTLFANSSVTDLWGSVLKTTISGRSSRSCAATRA